VEEAVFSRRSAEQPPCNLGVNDFYSDYFLQLEYKAGITIDPDLAMDEVAVFTTGRSSMMLIVR
jgi:hypothetical protein